MYTIELKSDATEAALARLQAALDDPFPLMQDLGELLTRSTKKRFAEGVSPDGVRWAPKSQTTLERSGIRTSNRVDIRPLFGPSGALNSTISPEPSRTEVLIGSALIYAAVQHFGAARGAFGRMSNGSPIPWGNIPARPFLGVSAEDEVDIAATVEDYLTGALRT
jgi:phage virion morphogenesis protein